MSFWWSPENIETLKAYYDRGMSCSEIAKRMPGTTRNAIIGKVHRLDLARRGHTLNRPDPVPAKRAKRIAREEAKASPPKPKRNPVLVELFKREPLPLPAATDLARVSFADLEPHHCRFPVGEPKRPGFGFCGADIVPGLPYCAHHARRCYAAPAVATTRVSEPVKEMADA